MSNWTEANAKAHDALRRQRMVMAMRRHLRDIKDDVEGTAALLKQENVEDSIGTLCKSIATLVGVIREAIDLIEEKQ